MERNPGNAAWLGSRRRCQDSQMGLSQIPCADRSVPFLRGTSLTNTDNPTLRNDCNRVGPCGQSDGNPFEQEGGPPERAGLRNTGPMKRAESDLLPGNA